MGWRHRGAFIRADFSYCRKLAQFLAGRTSAAADRGTLHEAESEQYPPSRVLAIIPTYNEASGIQSILNKRLNTNLPYKSSSSMTTRPTRRPGGASPSSVRSPAASPPATDKLGLGSAYKEGFRWAMERGFDTCIQIDADLSHNPDDIPRLLAALAKGADVAIGSRYSGGVRVLNWPQERLFLSLGASQFVRALTGLPLADVTSGFKAIRCDALRELDWKQFRTEGYGFQVELHYFLWKTGARLVEVPIVFTERRSGQTKMTAAIALGLSAGFFSSQSLNDEIGTI